MTPSFARESERGLKRSGGVPGWFIIPLDEISKMSAKTSMNAASASCHSNLGELTLAASATWRTLIEHARLMVTT